MIHCIIGLCFFVQTTPLALTNAYAEVATTSVELNSTTTIAKYISQEAEKKGVSVKLALSIAECESSFIPQQSKFTRPDGTREKSFGVWQIYLPGKDITEDQAMDIKWSTEWSLEQIKQGNAKIWSCYSYQQLDD